MEASAAGLGQGQGQGGDGQAQGQGEGGEGQGPDVAALAEQIGNYGQSMEQMRETLQGMQQFFAQGQDGQQQDGQQEAEQVPEMDLSFLDDPGLSQEQVSQYLTGMIDQRAAQSAQALLQQHLNPLSQQVADMRLESQAERLVQEFPEMAEQETAQKVVGTARQYAELMGQPELANNPAFWRLTYLAGRAADQANAEEGDQPAAAHLEGAGGAGPGGQQQDLVAQILNPSAEEGLGRRVLPF